jgi:threonine/homoserine/homoserine lactone efflux protein
MGSQFVAFVGISLLLIITPGPDMAVVMRNALLGGQRSGVFTALGAVTGLATWTAATSAGIAALLLASEPAFLAVKLIGAAYLIFLGAQALRGALRNGRPTAEATERRTHRPRITSAAAFRQGLISNLGNPKIAVFFTSLLPQFTPRGHTSFAALLALGLVFCSLGLIWLACYSVAVARAGDVLRRPRVRRSIEGLSGAVLVAFGLRLAIAHR